MSLSILDIAPVLAGDPDQQITWFQQRGLIARNNTSRTSEGTVMSQNRSNIASSGVGLPSNLTIGGAV